LAYIRSTGFARLYDLKQTITSVIFLLVFAGVCAQTDKDRAGELYRSYTEARDAGDFYQAYSLLSRIEKGNYDLPVYNQAVLYRNLGSVTKSLGWFYQSDDYYRSALEFCDSLAENGEKLYFNILVDLGLLHRNFGDYYRALEYLREARAILQVMELNPVERDERSSMVELNLGTLYIDLEDYATSLAHLKRSREIKERSGLGFLGNVYLNLGTCYSFMDQPALADSFFRESIRKWVSEYDSSYYRLGNVYLIYGMFLVRQEQYESGLMILRKALENFQENYGEKHTYISNCYYQIAEIYGRRDLLPEALEYIQRAIIAISPGFNDTSIWSNPQDNRALLDIRLLKNYGLKMALLSQLSGPESGLDAFSEEFVLQSALEVADHSVAIISRIQSSYGSRESRLYLTENQKDLVVHGIDIATKLYDLTAKEQYLKKAFSLASLTKSLEFSFERRRKEKLYSESVDELQADSLSLIGEKIGSLTHLIAGADSSKDGSSVQVMQWRQELFSLRAEYHRIAEEIGLEVLDTVEYKVGIDPVSDVGSQLGRKETLIDYTLSRGYKNGFRTLFAFVVSKKSIRVFRTALDEDFFLDVDTVVQAMYRHEARYVESLQRIYEKVFRPIEPFVGTANVTIIPDEEITSVPFELLVRTASESTDTYDQDFLLYHYRFNYALNPAYLNKPHVPLRFLFPKILTISSEDAGPLPGAGSEVRFLSNQFNSSHFRSPERKAELLKEFRGKEIIHFATHSVAGNREGESPFIRLSGDGLAGHRLYDYEINHQDIHSPMVVLNSCESGIGAYYSGEGMMSISRSFLFAGSGSVVQTLWPVEDITSSLIIKEFYRNLSKGYGKPRALQEARIRFIRDMPAMDKHPQLWAGFQVIGDPSPVSLGKYRLLVLAGLALLVIGLLLIIGYYGKWSRK